MRTYVIYKLDRISMFDPVTDLLLDNSSFLTWRKPNQIAPPGFPYLLAKLSKKAFLIEGVGWPHVSNEMFFTLQAWLDIQRRGWQRGLPPHSHSNYLGTFSDELKNGRESLVAKILVYNALVASDPDEIIDPVQVEREGPFELKFDGPQVVSWSNQYGRGFGGADPTFRRDWELARPALLDQYRQVQDERLAS